MMTILGSVVGVAITYGLLMLWNKRHFCQTHNQRYGGQGCDECMTDMIRQHLYNIIDHTNYYGQIDKVKDTHLGFPL